MEPERHTSLPFEVLERIDQVCNRFEQAWRSGSRPELHDYLGGDGLERKSLFRELLQLDLEYRLKQGDLPDAEEYRARFPEDAGESVRLIIGGILRDDVFAGGRVEASATDTDAPGKWSPSSTHAEPPLPPEMPGRYRIERVLGQGAFGVVYLARDLELGRAVAIKIAHSAHPVQGDTDAFLTEARVLASLDHPAIIPVYDVGRAEGRTYIVTKRIEGRSLSEEVRRLLPMPRQAAQWLETVARALQVAHAKGLVHRDVKPSNILIDEAGGVYIGDFGLALSEETFGTGARLLGTPAYMSAEQARGAGHRVDFRSDVFSLGAVLYELLTGRPPFQAASVSKTLEQVIRHDPVAPNRLNPTMGRDLGTICLKCLEKHPEKRYESAGALAFDLRCFLENRPILARPAGSVERILRWARRNPLAGASLASVAIIFLLAFALVSGSYWRAESAFAREALLRQESERREQAERWERYRSNLAAAGNALEVHNIAAAREALAAAPVEHRNWEWHYFQQQIDTSESVFRRPADLATPRISANVSTALWLNQKQPPCLVDVAARKEIGQPTVGPISPESVLSPDGKRVAFLRTDNSVVLWDIRANRQEAVTPRWDQAIQALEFSLNGKLLAAAFQDGKIRVLDAGTAKTVLVWATGKESVRRLAFSPDGRQLASFENRDHVIRLWDARSGHLQAELAGHSAEIRQIVFSPQSDRVLSCEGYPSNRLRLWDAATGKALGTIYGHHNEVLCMAFSPDGARIVTGSYDQSVRLWDGRSGKLLNTLQGHRGWVLSVAFSPDGARLISASQDQTARLWDAATGQALAVLHGHTSSCVDSRFAADGSAIVVAAGDGSLRYWNHQRVQSGGALIGHTDFVYDVAFHPDGRRVASASWDGTVRVWDSATKRQLAVLPSASRALVLSVAIHPRGELLAALGNDDCIRLWNLKTGTEVGRLPVPSRGALDSRLSFSVHGNWLACGGVDHSTHLWRVVPASPGNWDMLKPSEASVLTGHRGMVTAVAFGPDDSWLATAGSKDDPTVRIWDLARKVEIQRLESTAVTIQALAVDRAGRWLASGAADGTVQIWDTETWQPIATMVQGTATYGLAFTPDGTRLACACANNTIRLWDMATKRAVCDLLGHGAYVHQVAFSPDGKRLVSGSGDFTVRIWDSLPHSERGAPQPASHAP